MLSTCQADTYFSQCSVVSHGGGHFLRRLSAAPGCSGAGFLWRRCLRFPHSGAGIETRRLEGPLCPRGRSHSRSHFLPNCLPNLQIKHTLVKKNLATLLWRNQKNVEISFSVSNLVLQSHNQNKVWKNSFQQKKCLRPLKFWSFVTSKSLLTTYTCSVAKECIILLSNTLSFVEVLSLNIPLCFIRKKITLIIAINSDQSNWKHNSYQSVHTIHTSQIKRMGDPDKNMLYHIKCM